MIGVYCREISGVWFGVACEEQRIFGLSFACCADSASYILQESLPLGVPYQVFRKPSVFAEKVIAWVKNVYDGKDVSESFCFAMEHLPPYTRSVLEITSAIPVGYVASYGSISKASGGGARAVGNIMARNPFAPVVPCHRVVSSGFGLGGYSGGLEVEAAFLAREKRGYSDLLEIRVNGGKLQVFPVEFVLRKLGKTWDSDKSLSCCPNI
jgi:O-6-methylguanine DNA methyltransferase